ncbi:MAG: phospholipase A [Spirochaetales bacterium]|nr:phospholipase A [Spirochaetales bacterium]
MRKAILIFMIFLVCLPVFSQDVVSKALMGHEPIYFLFALPNDQVKLQLSFKYDLLYSLKAGLYLGYTQLMFWDLYNFSSPFEEILFCPEVFWEFRSGYNFLNDIVFTYVDFLRFSFYSHRSNGQDNTNSRGIETGYIQGQFGIGSESWRLGLGLKYHLWTWRKEESNLDYLDYLGPLEAKLFLYSKDNGEKQEELYIKAGLLGSQKTDLYVNFLEAGIMSRVLLSRFRPYLQFYYGYGESLLFYNHQSINDFMELPFRMRVGVILE